MALSGFRIMLVSPVQFFFMYFWDTRSYKSVGSVSKRLRDSILSAFFHSYIFAMYKNEALWI